MQLSPALELNAELAFSGQFRQRKKAKRTHIEPGKNEGTTRPTVRYSSLGSAEQNSNGGASRTPSGLVKTGARIRNQVMGQSIQEGKKVMTTKD